MVCVSDGRTNGVSSPPDGLVEGCTQDLVVVLGEAQTGHSFVVGMLKPAQAQPALYRPHLIEGTRLFLNHERFNLKHSYTFFLTVKGTVK